MSTFLVDKRYRMTKKGPRWSVAAYCRCGLAFRMTADSEAAVDRVVDLTLEGHQGPGHGSTDAASASRARRKTEMEATG